MPASDVSQWVKLFILSTIILNIFRYSEIPFSYRSRKMYDAVTASLMLLYWVFNNIFVLHGQGSEENNHISTSPQWQTSRLSSYGVCGGLPC